MAHFTEKDFEWAVKDTKPKLALCPFCGSLKIEPQYSMVNDDPDEGYRVLTGAHIGCEECSACGPDVSVDLHGDIKNLIESAIEQWNFRYGYKKEDGYGKKE